jgi:DNA-binding MarR family transcriptional regulator
MSTLRSSTCESGPEGDLVLDADDGAPRGAVSGLHGVSLRVFELGRRLGWEKSRLHHQLSRMCRRGLVQRHSGDGRAIHAAITAAGYAALKAAVPHHA